MQQRASPRRQVQPRASLEHSTPQFPHRRLRRDSMRVAATDCNARISRTRVSQLLFGDQIGLTLGEVQSALLPANHRVYCWVPSLARRYHQLRQVRGRSTIAPTSPSRETAASAPCPIRCLQSPRRRHTTFPAARPGSAHREKSAAACESRRTTFAARGFAPSRSPGSAGASCPACASTNASKSSTLCIRVSIARYARKRAMPHKYAASDPRAASYPLEPLSSSMNTSCVMSAACAAEPVRSHSESINGRPVAAIQRGKRSFIAGQRQIQAPRASSISPALLHFSCVRSERTPHARMDRKPQSSSRCSSVGYCAQRHTKVPDRAELIFAAAVAPRARARRARHAERRCRPPPVAYRGSGRRHGCHAAEPKSLRRRSLPDRDRAALRRPLPRRRRSAPNAGARARRRRLRLLRRNAVKVSAQQPIALIARLAHALDDARHRNAEQHQRVRAQHQAAFENFGNDFGCAGTRQLLEIVIVVGAHDDRQGWDSTRARDAAPLTPNAYRHK